MVQNVNEINKVKEENNLKEMAATNGPQGTVSQETQQSVQLLLRRGNRPLENTINPEFAKHIDWSTLLTTIVENLHAVSHFKHETFSVHVLQYAMDFGTIAKESLRRIAKWKGSYFTHPASYYSVPKTQYATQCR